LLREKDRLSRSSQPHAKAQDASRRHGLCSVFPMDLQSYLIVDPQVTLNRLLRCELCSVAAYDHVLSRLTGDPTGRLTCNRDCHAARVDLLRQEVLRSGSQPEEVAAPWPACLSVNDPVSLVTALVQGENDDLHGYRDRDGIDQSTADLVEARLLPAQQRCCDRLAAWLDQ
jgi:hypothetical protein